MRPELGGKNPLIRLKNVVLPGAVGADHRPQFARLDGEGDIADGDQAAEVARDVLDLKQGHGATLRRKMPSTPRGKNSTTSTKKSPMKDIQFSVWLEI